MLLIHCWNCFFNSCTNTCARLHFLVLPLNLCLVVAVNNASNFPFSWTVPVYWSDCELIHAACFFTLTTWIHFCIQQWNRWLRWAERCFVIKGLLTWRMWGRQRDISCLYFLTLLEITIKRMLWHFNGPVCKILEDLLVKKHICRQCYISFLFSDAPFDLKSFLYSPPNVTQWAFNESLFLLLGKEWCQSMREFKMIL